MLAVNVWKVLERQWTNNEIRIEIEAVREILSIPESRYVLV